jgi:predicted ATP-grasp superfamily ATP-dependent carboligase
VSSPADSDASQLDFLLNLASKNHLQGWMLFPTTDESVMMIARHHPQLAEHYRLSTPPWELLRRVCDKRLLYRSAADLGLAQPWTFCPRNRDELAALECPFPVVLKPAMRVGFNRLTNNKAWPVDNRAALLARYDEACELIDRDLLMVQEVIPGGGEAQFSYAAIFSEGSPLTSVVARRVRQFPADFGRFSTYVETVDEPGVIEPAVRLLTSIRFTGLVEVEFKKDPRDGRYKLLDVNPRVWGWHTLSNRVGIDFPYLVWLLASGESVPEVRGRAGERWVRMSADVPMAIQEILHGRLSLWSYLHSLGSRRESAIFAWDDPVPGFLEIPLLAYILGKRVVRRKGI